MGELRVGLMGLAGQGQQLAARLAVDPRVHLVAIGDRNPDHFKCLGFNFDGPRYEDYRSLIVENLLPPLDLLVVALEPFESAEFVMLAGQQGVAVWHTAPVARSVAEARRLKNAFARGSATLFPSAPWLFEKAFAALWPPASGLGDITAADVRVRVKHEPVGWRGDHAQAGGGVLLNGAYAWVQLLTLILGVPEEVYARMVCFKPEEKSLNYDTEDGASLVLRFSGGRVASLSAVRNVGYDDWSAEIFGSRAIATASPAGLRIQPRDVGSPVQSSAGFPCLEAAALDGVIGALANPDVNESFDSDPMAALAVIQAAYLSARTSSPESPRRFL